MPDRPSVQTAISDGVARVLIDRPGRANALNADTVDRLDRALDEVLEAGAMALILSGGKRHFCAGFDLTDLTEQDDSTLSERFLRIARLLERLLSFPAVTIADAPGAAIGAGADLVLACDLRIGSPETTLAFPGATFGLVLGTERLAQLVGTATTLDLVSTGRRMHGDEALGAGALTHLEDPKARAAERLAESLAQLNPKTLESILGLCRGTSQDGLDLLHASLDRTSIHARVAAHAERVGRCRATAQT